MAEKKKEKTSKEKKRYSPNISKSLMGFIDEDKKSIQLGFEFVHTMNVFFMDFFLDCRAGVYGERVKELINTVVFDSSGKVNGYLDAITNPNFTGQGSVGHVPKKDAKKDSKKDAKKNKMFLLAAEIRESGEIPFIASECIFKFNGVTVRKKGKEKADSSEICIPDYIWQKVISNIVGILRSNKELLKIWHQEKKTNVNEKTKWFKDDDNSWFFDFWNDILVSNFLVTFMIYRENDNWEDTWAKKYNNLSREEYLHELRIIENKVAPSQHRQLRKNCRKTLLSIRRNEKFYYFLVEYGEDLVRMMGGSSFTGLTIKEIKEIDNKYTNPRKSYLKTQAKIRLLLEHNEELGMIINSLLFYAENYVTFGSPPTLTIPGENIYVL